MTSMEPQNSYFIGWDVGGWNCDNNSISRDSIVILNSKLSIMGKAWRGNLRHYINEAKSTKDFIHILFSLCSVHLLADVEHVTLSIDTPLGFSKEFTNLVTGLKFVEPIELSETNPYLYRQTERYLLKNNIKKPLSAIKDMIGSQATKGMHVLSKFAPHVERCGVWSDGDMLTAIEAYPAACKNCESIEIFRKQVPNQPADNKDKMDALTCALIAYLFTNNPEKLIGPTDSVPTDEGWIWVPKDIIYEVKS